MTQKRYNAENISTNTLQSKNTQLLKARVTITFMPPTPTQQPTVQPSPVPIVKRSIRFGIVVDDYANKQGGLSNVEQKTALATVSVYKQFGLSGNKDLQADDLAYMKSKGYTLLIAWEPWNPEESDHQSNDYLSDIPAGKYDDYIKNFASGVKAYGNPVIIRFGHEMNGNWYPWCQRPDAFKTAYNYIVTLFRQEGVTNVSWMWSINADNVPYTAISDAAKYYPGNDTVNIIGIDGFNFGTANPGTQWRSFKDIFMPAYQYASQYGKPIIISETASAEAGGNKAEWIQAMFRDLALSFPNVTEIVWFNLNKETDWRIDSSSAALTAFQNGL